MEIMFDSRPTLVSRCGSLATSLLSCGRMAFSNSTSRLLPVLPTVFYPSDCDACQYEQFRRDVLFDIVRLIPKTIDADQASACGPSKSGYSSARRRASPQAGARDLMRCGCPVALYR